MAMLVNEKKMVENNIFQYEEKLKSPMSRFLDTTPTFVTYYHINADESTADEGYKDVSSILGFRSPIKYKKIEGFPLYGIDQVILQLQEQEQGLDSEFMGDAIILPNTIKPLQNDFFAIPYLHDVYLFRVTEIQYDNVMPDNFYKINYQLEYLDQEKVDALEKQSNEQYTCVLNNIGTENKCIIETGLYEKVQNIDNMYNDMVSTYMALFYNERYNCLLGDLGKGQKLYDPYQTEFINKHNLLNQKNNLKTIILTEQVDDKLQKIKYEKSVYRLIERRDHTRIHNFDYTIFQGTSYHESAFARWADTSVFIIDHIKPDANEEYKNHIFSNEFVTSVKSNGFTQSNHAELIQRFLRKENLTINDIPLDLNEELYDFNDSIEVFFIIPIIMYIIKEIVNEALK